MIFTTVLFRITHSAPRGGIELAEPPPAGFEPTHTRSQSPRPYQLGYGGINKTHKNVK